MALRYLLVVHKSTHGIHPPGDSPPGWTRHRSTTAFDLFVDGSDRLSSPSGRVTVLGHLFNRGDMPVRVSSIDAATERPILNTEGRALLNAFWGGYLVIVECDDGGLHILRDPSATLPCYFTETKSAIAFASDALALVETGHLTPQIDWSALSQHLFISDLRTPTTCLKDLAELPAGFCATVRKDRLTLTSCWSPWEHTDPDPFVNDTDLAERLRQTVTGSVAAWGRAFQRPLLGVSGGLDSSIVAASLKTAGVPFTAYTVATDEPDGDERRYATVLVRALEIDLAEGFHSLDAVTIDAPTSAHLPRPIGHAFGHSLTHLRTSLVRTHQTDAFFTGVGGDNVFCFTQSASPLVDRWRAGGNWGELRSTLDDVCRLTGCSMWQALGMAGRRALQHPAYRFTGDGSYLTQDWSHVPLSHPWLEAPKGAFPGKAAHVGMMVRILGTIDGFARDRPPDIQPLLSQPIVEACLRIPMWKWIEGGRNRSVVRQAFASMLPAALIDRTSKGGPNSFAYTVIDHHKTAIRERLLKGRLVDVGLIKADAVAAALAPETYLRPPDHMRVSMLLEAENWVRHWEAVAQKKKGGPSNTRRAGTATGAGITAPE